MLRRFAEYQDLQGAFGRRTMIERAKGILMERHGIDGDAAFELLRDHSRTDNRKLMELRPQWSTATASCPSSPPAARPRPRLPGPDT